MKGVGKIYVGGRPMPVRRQQNAKVQVVLRGSEETFSLRDAYAVWGLDVDMNELRGRFVIVEGDRGEDMGYIREVSEVADTEEPSFLHLPAVVRGANHFDVMQYDQLDALEADALEYCRACQDHVKVDSPFTIEAAVFQYDRKKLTLKYKSEDYVDFRELTRLLHNRYKCRIWMDQLNREARIDRREKEYHNNKRGNMRHRN
ncbi:hypothetical protein AGDE_10835 [Angomonas deanei]|nr:hypothetical protein AGDE_10835 [Angomonas deanei]|eukprot:EPY27299.1 hypothetical protein AGDE_10835 [Angomonas deanei]